MNTENRIKLSMTGQEMLYAMSEGNPGALNVMLAFIKHGKAVDPEHMFGGVGHIMSLDTLGIYGSYIWIFYKDICGEDTATTMAVLRAWQLGFLPGEQLQAAVRCREDYSAERVVLDLPVLIAKVKARLPSFNMEGAK